MKFLEKLIAYYIIGAIAMWVLRPLIALLAWIIFTPWAIAMHYDSWWKRVPVLWLFAMMILTIGPFAWIIFFFFGWSIGTPTLKDYWRNSE